VVTPEVDLIVNGDVIEGPVPAEFVKHLATELAQSMESALPGMPIGAPGMPREKPEVFDRQGAGWEFLLMGVEMNLYERWILPRLLDLVMRNKEVTRYRSRVVPHARGIVLEVGIGSGLNMRFYGPQVEQLFAVDPSEELLRMARRRAHAMPLPVEFFARSGEVIPLGNQSVDTVLTTFTLCTIPDPLAALREARRVLKSGGQLLFAEHGLAPDTSVRRWQHRCNPLWSKIAGGCNLNRKMDQLIRAAGFEITELETEYAKGPRPMSYVYSGRAQPIASAS